MNPSNNPALGPENQPAQPDLDVLRQSSFQYVRDRRPGDLPEAAHRQRVEEIALSFPEPEEQRYILTKLQKFAHDFAAAIPEQVRELAQYFEPPIHAPTEQQIVNEPETALRSLESIVKHLKFDRVQQQTYDRLIEDVRYVVEASSRAILGLGKEDKTEYQHVLRTLSSATSSFARFMDPIEEGLKKIPLPTPPPPPLPKNDNLYLDADQAANTRAPIRDLFATVAGEVGNAFGSLFRRCAGAVAGSWNGMCFGAERTGQAAKAGLAKAGQAALAGAAGAVKGTVWAASPLTWTVTKGWQLACYLAGKGAQGAVATVMGGIAAAKWTKNQIVEKSVAAAGAYSRFAGKHPLADSAIKIALAGGAGALLASGIGQLAGSVLGLSGSGIALAGAAVAGGLTAVVCARRLIARAVADYVWPAGVACVTSTLKGIGWCCRKFGEACAIGWNGFCGKMKRTGMRLSERGVDTWKYLRAGAEYAGNALVWAASPIAWTVVNGWKLACFLTKKLGQGLYAGGSAGVEGVKWSARTTTKMVVERSGQLSRGMGQTYDHLERNKPGTLTTMKILAVGAGCALLAAGYALLQMPMPSAIGGAAGGGGSMDSGQLALIAGVAAAGVAAAIYFRKGIARFFREKVVGGAVAAGSFIANEARALIYNPIANALADMTKSLRGTGLYRSLFARGRSLNQTNSYTFLSSDVVSYFKRHSRRSEHACTVVSQDRGFWDKMGVLDVHILDKQGGKTIQLDRYLDQLEQDPEKKEQIVELRKHLYRTTRFTAPAPAEPNVDETVINMPVRAGKMSILLPLGYQITGVSFTDGRGRALPETDYPVDVTECALGSAKVDVPLDARAISYRIRPGEFQVPPIQIERFKRLLPNIGTYKGIEGEAYADALKLFELSKSDEMKLLFHHQIDRGFKIVDDPFVKSFLRTAGSAVAEALGGMRLGSKDALSYHSACMFNANEVPSVLISGLVPEASTRSYPLKTGHSQTAVLTESGALVCDLSDKAEALEETSSATLMLRERYGMLRRIRGLNYHQIFDYASEVREVLMRQGRELPFFNSLFNVFFNWKGFGVPFVRRTYSDTKLDRNVQTDFDRIHLPKEERAVRALSKMMALERSIDYCRKQGSVTQVHYFHRENRALPGLRQEDVDLLPAEHRNLADYNVRGRVIDFTAESLGSDRFSPIAKRASVDWICSRLPGSRAVLNFTQGKDTRTSLNHYFHAGNSSELLTVQEVARLLTEETACSLTPKQSKQMLFGVLALPLAPIQNGESRDPELRDLDPASLATIAERALLLAQRMDRSDVPFNREEKEAVAILNAKMGNALLEKIDKGGLDPALESSLRLAVRQCAKTSAILTNLGDTDQVEFYFDLLMENKCPDAGALVSFAKAVGRDALFGSRYGNREVMEHLKSLGKKATETFCERKLGEQSFVNWWQTLEFFETMHLAPSVHADLPRIKRHMQRELAREARTGDIKIGYPDEVERPASFLCSKLMDKHSVDRIRLGQQLESHGLLRPGVLKEIWPHIKEVKVMSLLLQHTAQMVQDEPEDLRYGCRDAALSQPLAVAEIHALTNELLGSKLKPLHAAAAYNHHKRGGSRHWAETAIESLRDGFPVEWRMFLKQFDGAGRTRLVGRVLRELYDGVSRDEAYRGMLAYAAAGVGYDPAQSASKALENVERLSRLYGRSSASIVHAPVLQYFEMCEQMGPPFSGLGNQAKVAGMIGSALLANIKEARGEERKRRRLRDLFAGQEAGEENAATVEEKARLQEIREGQADKAADIGANATLRWFNERLAITKPLYKIVEWPIVASERTAEASVWRALFKPGAPRAEGAWDLSPLTEESRQKADMIQRRFREPLARFLYGRTGCVLVSSNSGDFKGYRGYAEGDSIRQIDWKRSVKDGELSVRVRDEEEARGLRLVYDTEYLTKAYHAWKKLGTAERSQHENPLRELFVICHLAARENVQVDLVLYGRSHMATFDGVVKRSSSTPRGQFSCDNFVDQLERYLRSSDEVFQAEKKIYGERGMNGVDIFAARDLPFKHGQLHLFGMDARNLKDSYVQRSKLDRRRVLNASFSETHDPRMRGAAGGS